MLRLSRHQKLKTFALVLSQSHPLLGSLSSALIREGIVNLWPRLKALFLDVVDQSGLERLSMFADLQILRLGRIQPAMFATEPNIIKVSCSVDIYESLNWFPLSSTTESLLLTSRLAVHRYKI
jgi:hypothetical protein